MTEMQKTKMKNMTKAIPLVLALLSAGAQAAVCTTNATGNWGTGGTWSCGHVPVAADTVVISRAITLSASSTIAGLTVNAGVTFSGNNRNLTVSGPVLISGTYNTGGGDLTTNSGGSLTVNGTFNFNNGNAAINGNVAIGGTLTSGGDNLQMTGTGTTLSGTGNIVDSTIEIDATGVSVPVGANLIFDANSEIDVAANVNPADLTVNGTIDGTAQGAGDRIIRVSTGGALTVGSTGVLNAPNSELNVRNGATATNNGTITIRDIIGRTGTPPVFTQGANSTLNVSGTVCATACTFNASATGNTANYTGAAQTVYVPSGSTYANLTLSGSGAKTVPTGLTVAENFTMSGTATVAAPAALAVGGDFTIGAGNTFTPGVGTVTLNGVAAQTISGNSPLSFNNLTVTNATNPNITLATNVVVNGTLTGTVNLTTTCPTDYALTSNGGATVAHSCSQPVVTSINMASANPTVAASVDWTVTFNQSVTGVSPSNFTLVNGGLGGAPAITLVSGSGTTWTVTASTGTGTGTLGLNMTNVIGISPAVITSMPFTGQVYSVRPPAPVIYYHDTTLGVNVGFDGLTNVTGANQIIPPIITASLNPVSTCPVTRARSNNHPTGLYTHSRWYLNADYAVATNIGANPTGSASLRGGAVTDTVIVSLYDYDPVTGAKVLIGSSAPITLTGGGTTTTYLYTITSALYTVPAGHRLMLEYNFNQPVATYNARVYCSAIASFVSVTETPAPLVPVAEYRMDEGSWNGTANEVGDSSASNHGTAASLSATKPTTAGTSPAIAGDPGTCRYGTFIRANKDYVALPAAFPNLGTQSFTITAWIRTSDNTQSGQRVFIDDESNTQGYGFSLGDGGTGNLRFFSRGTPSALILDSGNVIANNAWYFVAAVGDVPNKLKRIYVYNTAGTLLANVNAVWTEASFGSDAGIASIGGETNASGEGTASFGFSGNIDEVSIYQSALSAGQVDLLRQATHACPAAPLDHISIEHASGQGLTCTPSTLTIKACMDAACSSLYTGGVTGTLTATGTPTVNWAGGAGFSIPVGSSSTTKDVQVTTAGSVVFGTSGIAPAPAATTTCDFGAPSCTFTAADAGFLVSAPDHIAETASTLTVQAVKKADNSLVCVPAFASAARTVNLKCSYVNPASGPLPARVGGAALNAANNAAAACDASGANVSLNFDASGIATPSLQYADVGEMQVSAGFAGTPGSLDEGLVMTGSGNFIAAPASFAFSGITAGPIKAGDPFGATVTALNAASAATPNFGKEGAPEGVTLGTNLVSPAGGSNPPLGNNVIGGGTFTNGAATVANLSWDEAGSIELTATLTSGNYLGSGVAAATGTSATVGAFIPHHFDTAVVPTATLPMPCPTGLTCPLTYDGFVYSGQPFSVQITARNLAGGTTTNYDGVFGISRNVTLTAWDAKGGSTQNPGSGVLGGNAVASTAFISGIATLIDTPAYTFDASPTAPTDIYVRATDTDGVTSLRTTPSDSVEGGVKVASGRVKIGNAHGSELLNLPMSATVQYYDGTYWTTSATDDVTSFDTTLSTSGGNLVATIISGLGGGITVSSPGTAAVVGGVRTFRFAAPGVRGSANISLNAPAYLPSNIARATFGVYKGNNEFIYLRETY